MTTSLHLERREPVHHRQRFYAITVTRTLFGSWALVREWGRIGQPGTVRETWFEMEGAARAGIRRRQNALPTTNAGAASCCITSPW